MTEAYTTQVTRSMSNNMKESWNPILDENIILKVYMQGITVLEIAAITSNTKKNIAIYMWSVLLN